MDYYGVLNAEKDSSDIEIKKLYFKQVKEYPPEKFPEKFKEIRLAYETLSDPKLKRAYNEKLSIPEAIEKTLKSVEKLLFNDELNEAIRILQSLESYYPKLTAIKIKLAKAYLENRNYGKAVKVMENVVKIERGNPEHLAFLAHAYSKRGFNKKAISAFRESLALDASDYDVWIKMTDLLINYNKKLLIKSIDEMLAADETYNWENIEIFLMALKGKRGLLNQKEIDKFVDKIVELKDTNYISTPVQYATIVTKNLEYLDADYISQKNIDKLNEALMDLASKDATVSKVIDELKVAQLLGDFMEDPIFDSAIISLINILARKLDVDEIGAEILLIESYIASNKSKFRKQLLHLKINYLHLYNLNKYFFDCVLKEKGDKHLIQYMIEREEEMDEFISEMIGEYDYEGYEPYVREEPKIGRNDPCPCGSGKKYKKCCGLN